jgi:outer membrane protein assembly factor BamB
MDRRTFLQIAFAAPTLGTAANVFAQEPRKPAPRRAAVPPKVVVPWTQWGGPQRNFQTDASGLRDTWPASGPRVLWKRSLGEGYSSVVVEGAAIYTMYGRRGQETVLAANGETGKTLWEHSTPMTFQSDAAQEMGNGPYATPLLLGQRLFTAGVSGRLQCLDRAGGKVIWTQQLWEDHGGSRMMYGYASSPIAYRETVIVPVGGRGKSVMAFNQADGKTVWARHDFGNVYSSPILIDVGGLEQLVTLMDGSLVGLNPANGDLQWVIPFKADYSIAIATPLWGPDNLLFVSSEYNGGAKVIELQRQGQRVVAKELWSSNRLRLHHGNAMRIGDTIYFTSGGKGSPAILTAADVRSGDVRWQERSIAKATFVWADGKLVTLDQSGTLMIAHPSPQGFRISARAPLLTSLAWTPPTLVGTRVYLRDRRDMMAVDLG